MSPQQYSVVDLVLNVGDLNVKDLGEDLANSLPNGVGHRVLDSSVRSSGNTCVSEIKHDVDVVGLVIQVEEVECVDGNCSHGIETAREGVHCAANGDHNIIKVAFTIQMKLLAFICQTINHS